MAVAPPNIRALDVLVLSETRARDIGVMALVRYLQRVRPRVLVLMGRAWTRHLRGVTTFKDALLTNELERLIGKGTRAYLLDHRLRASATIRLPCGRTVAHRADLRLRIEGQWIWFGARELVESSWQRLGLWVKDLPAGLTGKRDRGRAALPEMAVVAERAIVEGVDAMVLADVTSYVEVAAGERRRTIASPGAWHAGERALEFRFGQWSLRTAPDASAEESSAPAGELPRAGLGRERSI